MEYVSRVAQTPPQRHGKVTYFQRPAAPPAFGRGGGHWPPTGLLPPLATPLGEGRLYPSPAPFAHRLHRTGGRATFRPHWGRRGYGIAGPPHREPLSGHRAKTPLANFGHTLREAPLHGQRGPHPRLATYRPIGSPLGRRTFAHWPHTAGSHSLAKRGATLSAPPGRRAFAYWPQRGGLRREAFAPPLTGPHWAKGTGGGQKLASPPHTNRTTGGGQTRGGPRSYLT